MSADEARKENVQLFVYDMSKGMARSLSTMFLGREIAGLWHTAIVAYGREIFFGGAGISSCDPGVTMLGQPDQRIDLGTTEIPEDLFMEYLFSLGGSVYSPGRYDLFTHNCNNFSNELAVFLTGTEIPKHILDLPNDILSSPLGPFIRAAFSNVQISPGGHGVTFAGGQQSEDNRTITSALTNEATTGNESAQSLPQESSNNTEAPDTNGTKAKD